MAGGKETPRQKMIGMMYLVLTALLALNVSKSILDAFVAIEENTQKSNIAQLDRGDGFIKDVNSEITTTKGPDNAAKLAKLKKILAQMQEVDKITAVMIEDIDKIKMEILKESGEDVAKIANNDELTIIWEKGSGCKPTRMNLMAVQAKDQYDIPMHHIVGEDIKNPTGSGKKLWADYNKYRADLVRILGSYKDGEKTFSIDPKAINKFATNKKLAEEVAKMIDNAKVNKDDKQVLKDIYINLTKPERVKQHDLEGVHWIGATFDHSPLVAAVASLSSMQQDILSARAMALAHLKSKVTTGEYSFNKIVGLAYGPMIANTGDEVELQVMMAAFDSDNQPEVTGPGSITVEGGQGKVKTKVSGGAEMVLNGTVSIKNKSGVKKTENWSHTIKIMKPQGTVSLPDMRVLYRGYPNLVEAVASGYDQTTVRGAGVTLTKQGTQWVGTPGAGKTCTITVSGTNSVTKKTVSLGTFEFQIKSMPKAEIYWGQAADGEKGSITATQLYARYGDGIPLTKAKFQVNQWAMSIPGAPKTVTGSGSTLSAEAMRFLKAAPKGSQVGFSCIYSGTGVKNKVASAMFKL